MNLQHPARRLADGSHRLATALGHRTRTWIAAGRRTDLTGWRSALGPALRAGLLLGTAYLLTRAVRATPALMWLLTGAWLAAAWRAGRTKNAQKTPDADRPTADPEDVHAATLDWIRDQIGDRNGIHLADLLAHAQAHGLHTDLDPAAFRAALDRWGIPVRDQLKVRGRNRPGVHRDDLPAPSPAPSTAQAA
ncbi:hypothetical protein ABZ714_30650 [Streptomyces sp. NPDC006798]|uniref:hypothetical protein n=1 Tax=Streptomyces sp. NPDC006798 TaxID=3155462 RepID=UPI0033F4C9B8